MSGVILPRACQPDPELVLWTGGSRLLASLLHGRGIVSRDQVEHLLHPLNRPEPEFSSYAPLQSAVKRIRQAVANGEKIAIYGDYDVDGITAVAVLVWGIEQLGGNVIWHVPNRFSEGYGMHPARVRELASAGVGLIVTCDCGISNCDEVELANSLGVDVVVTDHHTLPPVLPPAHSIVNFHQLPPNHPSRDLPGVGTAFVLIRILLAEQGIDASELLDLVALGIIADVVPLIGHNRQLYAKGLPLLNRARRPGLAKLFAVARITPGRVDEEKLAFQVAPRLNAAGRLQDGSLAVKLLLAQDEGAAAEYARQLDQLNRRRKELGNEIMEQIKPEPGKPLVAYCPHWHQGVLGIVAGQICSGNNVPAVLVADSRHGDILVGSSRSLPGIDIYQVLAACSQYLEKFGGHPAAAGFSLRRENLEDFCAAVEQTLQKTMARWKPLPLKPELAVQPQEIKLPLVEELGRLAPYGEGNPRPLLYCPRLTVKAKRNVGSGYILLLGRRHSFSAGLWQQKTPPAEGKAIGAVFTLSEDHYRGERSVWATLEAWWPGPEAPTARAQGPALTDMRGKSWRQILARYPDAVVFREGAEWLAVPGTTRMGIEPASLLILLTAPASPGILRQVLAAAEPEQVVLAFAKSNGTRFLQELSGAVKYVLNRQDGIVRLSTLASALGHREDTLLAGLQLLANSNILDFQLEDGKLILQQLAGRKIHQGRDAGQLRYLLEETAEFRRWLLKAGKAELAPVLR